MNACVPACPRGEYGDKELVFCVSGQRQSYIHATVRHKVADFAGVETRQSAGTSRIANTLTSIWLDALFFQFLFKFIKYCLIRKEMYARMTDNLPWMRLRTLQI